MVSGAPARPQWWWCWWPRGRRRAALRSLPSVCPTMPHFPSPPPPPSLSAPAFPSLPCRYDNCEMRTVVLADEDGTHVQHDSLHFRGGHHI